MISQAVLRIPSIFHGIFMFAGAFGLCLLVCGCGSSGLDRIKTSAEVRQIISSNEAVMVDFYKDGCEHCGALEITLNHLADQYGDRLKAVKFMLQRADGGCIDQKLADEHKVLVYPTVIFFVSGQERKRFEQQYNYSDYESAIQECIKASKPR